jgi:hypothetical protein
MNRLSRSFSFTLVAFAAAAALGARPSHAQSSAPPPEEWQGARTPWGDPDLQGTWPLDFINGTPVQRPLEFGERRYLSDEEYAERVERLGALNARYDEEIASNRMNMGHWSEMGQPNRLTSLIVEPASGRVPAMTERGRVEARSMTSSWSDIPFDDIDDFNALDRCITRGMPASMFPFMYNSGIEVLQSPGYVVIRLELIHEARIVPLDGRPSLDPEIRQWMGESRGRFEGDTLVIETTNFNGKTPMLIVGPGGNPIPTSTSLRIVERLTRVAEDSLEYELEVEDPEILTAPWKAAFPWKLDPEYRIYEYACHEGNTIIPSLINATRVARERERSN